jgi:putative tryptophan/tyrosine transport system substrate-binding protein
MDHMTEKIGANKMKDIILLILIGLLVTAGLVCNKTPARIFTIGIVNNVSILSQSVNGFKAGMAELGYVEGKNVRYIHKGIIDNDQKVVDDEIRNLLAQNIDILLTIGNGVSLRAKNAVEGTDMPVLFCACNKPIEAGLIESMNHPGFNITGVAVADSTAKALEWLKIITPGLKKVYLPFNPDDEVSIVSLSGVDEAASKLGLELILNKIRSVEEAVAAIENLPKDATAIFRIPSPTLDSRNNELSHAAIQKGLPMGARLPLDKEVLLTFATDLYDVGKDTARLAHQIHLGVKPMDLPVETAETFLTINLKTAERIGLHIPDDVLTQAKNIIR